MLKKEIVSRWSHYLENMTQTPQEFYTAVERSIRETGVPEVTMKRIEHREGGLMSAKREYLQIKGRSYFFDICAAPYGKAFFVSYWQRGNRSAKAELLSKIPIIGKVASAAVMTDTFFEADTEQMFLSMIHTCIVNTIDKELENKGLRALSESQRRIPQSA